MPVNLSYPKPRDIFSNIIKILRTDSSTPKTVLPKGAFVVRVNVIIDTSADGGSPVYTLGWSGTPNALLNSASIATRGTAFPSTTSGTSIGVQLDSDKEVIGTFAAGGSTTGSTGYIIIEYIIVGPGEGMYD